MSECTQPPARTAPTFRIVVATRGRPDDLAGLLGLLAPQLEAHPNFHLVVVNDASPEPAYGAAVAPFRHLLDYRVLPDQRGPGLARQAGLADGDEDYFVTTDDDCLPAPDWLARTQALATAYPRVDLFAGSTRAVASERPGMVEGFLIDNNQLPGAMRSQSGGLVLAVCAILMCRREAFEAVGGFSPEIRGSAQDWNLTYRLLQDGCRYMVCSNWTIGHRADASFLQTLRRRHRYGLGAAQHVLLEQDWEGALVWHNGPPGKAIGRMVGSAQRVFNRGRRAKRSLARSLGYGLIGAATTAALQWGWRRGLAVHGTALGRQMPRDLALSIASPLRRPAGTGRKDRSTVPSIRIVVATYRRPDDLESFLATMVPQVRDRDNVTLVVVNDGTHDAAYQRVVEGYAGAVDYRPQPVNGGPGAARTIGCADAREDYLVFTDDDCLAPPGWLDWLEALIEAYPEVDLFAGRTLPVNSGRPGLMERLMTYTNGFPGPLTSAGRGLVNAVTANVACRRKAYAAAGGFNPAMTAAAEDWFLTTRLLDTGASYRVCNEWIMGHKGEQGFRDNLRRYYNYGWGGAQNILLTGDWPGATEMHSGTTPWTAMHTVADWLAATWNAPRIRARPYPARLIYTVLSIMLAIQYERGWFAGLRHFSAELGKQVPRTPDTASPLADFVMAGVQREPMPDNS